MNSSLVSILIPVYNREEYITETIQSALNQTYSNIEIIVVDNCSTDKSWEIIKTFLKKDQRVKAFRNDSNIGPVKNWIRCIEVANGEYGKILWSDDLLLPDCLSVLVPLLNNKEVGFAFSKTKIFDDSNGVFYEAYQIGKTGYYDSEKYIKGIFFGNDYPVSPGCAIFRLTSLKKNMLLNVDNSIGSDFSTHAIGNDLLLFLLTANEYDRFAYSDEVLSMFRSHKDSISVASNSGKLEFFYHLAKVYFVENCRIDLRGLQNLRLWMHMNKYLYYKNTKINKLNDFYINKARAKFSVLYVIEFFLSKLDKYVRRLMRR